MAPFRAFAAVLAGTLLAFVLGAIYDYLPEGTLPDPGAMRYMYPWLFAGIGFISALVSISVFYPAVSQAAVRAALKAGGAAPSRSAARQAAPAIKSGAAKTDVPGMPGFDFDAAKAKIDELKQGDPASRAAPAGPPPPGSGSRPATSPPETPKSAE